MRAKPLERAKARELRAGGRPYKQIARALQVSPGSVYEWTKDITLSPEQLEVNRRAHTGPQSPDAVRRRSASWIAKSRHQRALCQQDGRRAARDGNLLHQAGALLYWAEGSKRRNTIQFTNSDPNMVVLFRRFLTDALAIEEDEILLTLNVYTNNGLTVEEIEQYWLDLLELPPSAARKHTLDHMPTSSSGRAKKRLPYGVCTLRVHSTWMVQHIYGAIQEYAGFDEPAWLD
jgi:hypothetical protein